MSIVTAKYFDVPRLPPEFERDLAQDDEGGCGHEHWNIGVGNGKKRRFFESGAEWDPVKRVITERARAGMRSYGHAQVVNEMLNGIGIGVSVQEGDRDSLREDGEELELDVELDLEDDE